MPKLREVSRFRMKPTKTLVPSLNRMAGARRYVRNWALARKREHDKEFSKTLARSALSSEWTALKTRPETAWLNEADSQGLQQVLKDLDRACVNYFEKRSRFPRFTARKSERARFRIPQQLKVVDGKVVIPKIGGVHIDQSQPVTETTRSATFRREADGKWYVSLTAEFEMPDVWLPTPDLAKVGRGASNAHGRAGRESKRSGSQCKTLLWGCW